MSTATVAKVFADKGVRWILGGWVFFIGENLVLSHNRQLIIEHIGDRDYHLAYSALSTSACASILWGYLKHGRNKGPLLCKTGLPGQQIVAFTLQALGLIGFSQLIPRLQVPIAFSGSTSPEPSKAFSESKGQGRSVQQGGVSIRCPMDFSPPDVPADGVYGLKRVTRHPTFWSLGLLGLGTALTTPFVPEICFFSMPAVFAYIGGAHQDYRFRRGWGGKLDPAVDAATSHVPFAALLSGKQPWHALPRELKDTNAALAVAVAAALALRRRGRPPRV